MTLQRCSSIATQLHDNASFLEHTLFFTAKNNLREGRRLNLIKESAGVIIVSIVGHSSGSKGPRNKCVLCERSCSVFITLKTGSDVRFPFWFFVRRRITTVVVAVPAYLCFSLWTLVYVFRPLECRLSFYCHLEMAFGHQAPPHLLKKSVRVCTMKQFFAVRRTVFPILCVLCMRSSTLLFLLVGYAGG